MVFEKLEIYTDGGARGNPGLAAVAFVVKRKNKTIHQQAEKIGLATNNVAEYLALLKAFRWLQTSQFNQEGFLAVFNLDSKLVVEQLKGNYKIKNQNLKKFFWQIKNMEKNLKIKILYQQIPRALNYQADALVNQVLDEF